MVGWWGRKAAPAQDPLRDSRRRCLTQSKERRKVAVPEYASAFDALDEPPHSRPLPEKPHGRPSSRCNVRNGRQFYALAAKFGSQQTPYQKIEPKEVEREKHSIRQPSISDNYKDIPLLQASTSFAGKGSSYIFAQSHVHNPVAVHESSESNIRQMTATAIGEEASLAQSLCPAPACQDSLPSLFPSFRDHTPASCPELVTEGENKELPMPGRCLISWHASEKHASPQLSIKGDDRQATPMREDGPPSRQFDDCTITKGKQVSQCEEIPQETYKGVRSLSQCSTCEDWESACASAPRLTSLTLGEPEVSNPCVLSDSAVPSNIDDMCAQDMQAGTDLCQQLAEATKNAVALRARIKAIHDAAEAEAAEVCSRRQAATDALRELVGPPLAEIKRLANSPPESIRRTLAATWVLLHCERWAKKATVGFDDVAEWCKVQRMLNRDSFVSQISNFSPEKLDKYPTVRDYLRSVFFADHGHDCDTGERSARKLTSKRVRSASRREAKVHAPVVTALEAVERASRPCGALARWIITLLIERQALKRLDSDNSRAALTSELAAAEDQCAQLTRAVGLAHAAKLAECAKQRAVSVLSDIPLQRPESPKEIVRVQLPVRPNTAPPPAVPRMRELPIREVLRRQVHGST